MSGMEAAGPGPSQALPTQGKPHNGSAPLHVRPCAQCAARLCGAMSAILVFDTTVCQKKKFPLGNFRKCRYIWSQVGSELEYLLEAFQVVLWYGLGQIQGMSITPQGRQPGLPAVPMWLGRSAWTAVSGLRPDPQESPQYNSTCKAHTMGRSLDLAYTTAELAEQVLGSWFLQKVGQPTHLHPTKGWGHRGSLGLGLPAICKHTTATASCLGGSLGSTC